MKHPERFAALVGSALAVWCVDAAEACWKPCDVEYKPACATTGRWFLNDCALSNAQCKNAAVALAPSVDSCGLLCKDTAPCSTASSPSDVVCGSDGVSYPSECHMRLIVCANDNDAIVKVHDGPCAPPRARRRVADDTPAATPMRKPIPMDDPAPAKNACFTCVDFDDPVCGTDGRTYSNDCFLELEACKGASVVMAYPGNCSANGPPPTTAPVPSPLDIKISTMKEQPNKPSPSTPAPTPTPTSRPQFPTPTPEPVTSAPEPTATPAPDDNSSAKEPTPSPTPPATSESPSSEGGVAVCGSDGNTYDNACFLELAQCLGEDVEKVHDGDCAAEGNTEDKLPSSVPAPASASSSSSSGEPSTTSSPSQTAPPDSGSASEADGNTYENACFLQLAQCLGEAVHEVDCSSFIDQTPSTTEPQPGIDEGSMHGSDEGSHTSDAQGCKSCPEGGKPVCGSDGNTYTNACFLELAQCLGENVEEVECKATPSTDSTAPAGSGPKAPDTTSLSGANVVGRTSASHASNPNPPACPECSEGGDPVCGSDGDTYDNECFLKLAQCMGENVVQAFAGSCEAMLTDAIPEPPPTDPIQTLAQVAPTKDRPQMENTNSRMQMAHTEVEVTQSLLPLKDAMMIMLDVPNCPECSEGGEPVCGSDGNEYANECYLRVAQCVGETVHQVDCAPPGIDHSNDGMTATGSATGTATTDADSPAMAPTETVSPSSFDDIGGTGLLNDVSNNDPSSDLPNCPMCTQDWDPVCGSNGITYSNNCSLSVAQCQGVDVVWVFGDECDAMTTPGASNNDPNTGLPSCPMCTQDWEPVCGSNGITYSNNCSLSVAQCQGVDVVWVFGDECDAMTTPGDSGDQGTSTGDGDVTHPPPTSGDDCQRVCTDEYKPICGTDGKQYGSRCELQVAQCDDSSLHEAYPGPCLLASATGPASPPLLPIYPWTYVFDPCTFTCPDYDQPICGGGQRYRNMCEYARAVCKDSRLATEAVHLCDASDSIAASDDGSHT
ncbi:TPA: hypothetical protein N0F65_000802 [Lagenidium giganteum]|uniref:Kazal-like domain-containing protein n=1 Tax=Lagenidium giganteum TaxID=4803 RepID=A0AAV2ZKX8_9STRA|nr:TPA: hypothetical protein N0F65_000802 [Lagenidium giganteum]